MASGRRRRRLDVCFYIKLLKVNFFPDTNFAGDLLMHAAKIIFLIFKYGGGEGAIFSRGAADILIFVSLCARGSIVCVCVCVCISPIALIASAASSSKNPFSDQETIEHRGSKRAKLPPPPFVLCVRLLQLLPPTQLALIEHN